MNNRPQDNNQTVKPYSVRTKRSGHKTFTQIYVPSAQGHAWIYLVDPPQNQEALDVLYDPEQLPDWKVEYLKLAYQEFRQYENLRKNPVISYSDWEVEVHESRTYTTISLVESQAERRNEMANLLGGVSNLVRRRLQLNLIDGYTFVEIARIENPKATESDIKTAANSIGRSVKRAIETLKKKADQ